MIGFKDRTWCDFYQECKHGNYCNRALTPEVREAAANWWGSAGAPIAMFIRNPECFKDVYEVEKDKQT